MVLETQVRVLTPDRDEIEARNYASGLSPVPIARRVEAFNETALALGLSLQAEITVYEWDSYDSGASEPVDVTERYVSREYIESL